HSEGSAPSGYCHRRTRSCVSQSWTSRSSEMASLAGGIFRLRRLRCLLGLLLDAHRERRLRRLEALGERFVHLRHLTGSVQPLTDAVVAPERHLDPAHRHAAGPRVHSSPLAGVIIENVVSGSVHEVLLTLRSPGCPTRTRGKSNRRGPFGPGWIA